MVYFSDLESAGTDVVQSEAVWKFRQQLREKRALRQLRLPEPISPRLCPPFGPGAQRTLSRAGRSRVRYKYRANAVGGQATFRPLAT